MKAKDGRQLKAARAMLGMTIKDMAQEAGINRNSVLRVEKLKKLPRHCWAGDRIADALERKGIAFTNTTSAIGIKLLQ